MIAVCIAVTAAATAAHPQVDWIVIQTSNDRATSSDHSSDHSNDGSHDGLLAVGFRPVSALRAIGLMPSRSKHDYAPRSDDSEKTVLASPSPLGSPGTGSAPDRRPAMRHPFGVQPGDRIARKLPSRLSRASYEIRGKLHDHAQRLEAAGQPVLKLDIGNPAAYGFSAPEGILAEVANRLVEAQAYAPANGMAGPRRAAAAYVRDKGIPLEDEDEVYLGNGVSELALMGLQALVDDGDEVLVPAPGYPLWAAGVTLAGGVPVYYLCDETAGWLPDVEAMQARITARTKALVVINPHNPTGAVYPPSVLEAIVEVARRHGLVVLSDEIYDQILYDGVTHTATAALGGDLVCLTFNGLSKAYLLAGYRSGWLTVTGPQAAIAPLRRHLDLLAGLRLGANVPGQCALEAALSGRYGHGEHVLPGGRLRNQRDAAFAALSSVPGISCIRPAGGFYAFPRVDRTVWRFHDTEQLLLDVLDQRHVLFSPGATFNWSGRDHFRVVTLATVEQLEWAARQLSGYLADCAAAV
jgi:alanine-synthesizing transaminase